MRTFGCLINQVRKVGVVICLLLSLLGYGRCEGSALLTDPFLQNPTSTAISVVWFTAFPGKTHFVRYGDDLEKTALGKTTLLSHMRDDCPDGSCAMRTVYRHEVRLTDLIPDQKSLYQVVSQTQGGEWAESKCFFCTGSPSKNTSLQILLTSDHQLKPMVAANLQKAYEICPQIDAVFFAGDCVNHADCAIEWFDLPGSFFRCFQGRGGQELFSSCYQGAPILQNAPLFPAIGNHEVMGRWVMNKSIDFQFNDAVPKEQISSQEKEGKSEKWVKEHSFNTDSYEEIFSLPTGPSNRRYYALTFGDVRLIVLYATRIWRHPQLGIRGKYTENPKDFSNPDRWGYGDFIFETIDQGSKQYRWLENELQSAPYKEAKYKIVMLHHPLHSLGENAVPPYVQPEQIIEYDDAQKIESISYRYSKEKDQLILLEPLFEQHGVDLVLCGHTHVWNRFQKGKLHFLETSNVGNSYGAYLNHKRSLIPWEDENYSASKDPNGLRAQLPSLAPLEENGEKLPYLSSNTITAFSLFNTQSGSVDSYYYDTEKKGPTVHFDRFYLNSPVRPISTLVGVQENAQRDKLPDIVIFDIDNTLIESESDIGLDPSINGLVRNAFADGAQAERVIRRIQKSVPWKLCEERGADVVRFFQKQGVFVIGVTKRSSCQREDLERQLKKNGIAFDAHFPLTSFEGGLYDRGVLYACGSKGEALKDLFEKRGYEWEGRAIYCIDDRKSHLDSYLGVLGEEAQVTSFEYVNYQVIDEALCIEQLKKFSSSS